MSLIKISKTKISETGHRWLLLLALFAIPAFADNVAEDPWSIQPLLTGAKAPGFEAVSADGSKYQFNPEALERPALVIFYRGGWCMYCNLHWAELRKIEDQLLALEMDLIFLSADSPETLAEAMQEEEKPKYHLLSDNTSAIAQAFGIAFRLDDDTVGKYVAYGLDIEAVSGFKHHVLPVPSVFIIDTDGIIKFQYVNPDYTIRIHPDVLLAAARNMPDRSLR